MPFSQAVFKKKSKVPWAFFLLFLLTNTLLSHAHFSLQAKLGVALVGCFLPLIFLLSIPAEVEKDPFSRKTKVPLFLTLAGLFLIALAVFLRFYRLTSFSHWPLADEAMFGLTALGLSHDLVFQPFYGSSQVPFLYVLILAIVFKLAGPSLASLWFVPALFSALTVPLVYLSVRQWWGSLFGWLLTWLWAFSFWPLYEGRFSVQYPLYVFWIWLVFYLFTVFWKAPEGRKKGAPMALLAAGVAGGFCISVSWILPAAGFTLALLATTRNKKWFWAYLLLCSLFCLPMAFAASNWRFSYFQSLLVFGEHFSLPDYLLNVSRYFAGLFWGTPLVHAIPSYGPHWGGMLNPLLGAFFFMGLAQIRRLRFGPGIPLLFLLGFTPALFTNNLEYYRIIQVLPVLLFVAAWGAWCLFQNIPHPWRGRLLAGALLLSASLDLYHLFGPCSRATLSDLAWPVRSRARYQAYRHLEEKTRLQGPGLILDKFMEDPVDGSLAIASHSFNALVNPSLAGSPVSWVAVMTNIHYQPFLEKRFKSEKVYWLSKDDPPPDGGWMLWLAPLTPARTQTVKRWREADRVLADFAARFPGRAPAQPLASLLDHLRPHEATFRADPFLESFWWSKIAELRFQDCLTRAFQMERGEGLWETPSGPPPSLLRSEVFLRPVLLDLKKAVDRGYPAAHLYYRSGTLWALAGNQTKAKENLEKSLKAPFNFTQATLLMGTLTRPERGR